MTSREAGEPEASPYRRPYRRAPDNPWWIAPFLGRVPPLPPSKMQMLGVIALAFLFENYDQAMLTAALKQISEGFGVAESDLGDLMGRIYGGAIVAFFLVPFADRIGRRRLFLLSLMALSLATFLSAFAQTVNQFILLQMVARTFMVTCSATAFVIIAEELPAEHRGWGIGILGALGALGYGLGLLLFAAIDLLPYGWRALYVVGVVPVLMLPRFRRQVTETRRFTEQVAAAPAGSWWRPFYELGAAYPGRAAAVAAIGLLSAGAHAAGFNFAAYHAQTVHGWLPVQYTTMAVVAGLVGVVGHPWAGRAADQRGRHRVGFVLFAAFPFLALAFYHGPAWVLPFAWIPFVFTLTGSLTIQRALSTELFPTSYRGTAAGWLQLWEAVGRTLALFLVAWGTAVGASNTPMVSLLVFASLGAGLVLLAVPETGSRELEDISAEPERGPGS